MTPTSLSLPTPVSRSAFPSPSLDEVTRDLGFVLAIDGCARGCRHCPAFGSRAPVRRAGLEVLAVRLSAIAATRARLGLPVAAERTVHCWRISDPLDYAVRIPAASTVAGPAGVATAADVAGLWRDHLGQGLYVVTNGSEGHRHGRAALRAFAAHPELVSQLKITITPADPEFGTIGYAEELAEDLRLVQGLWELPAARREAGPGAVRLRLNVKTTPATEATAREVTALILRHAGLTPAAVTVALDDPHRVAVKPIYDLGCAGGGASPMPGAREITDAAGTRHKPTPETRSRYQFGIRPDGRIFRVDLWGFAETDLVDQDSAAPLVYDGLADLSGGHGNAAAALAGVAGHV